MEKLINLTLIVICFLIAGTASLSLAKTPIIKNKLKINDSLKNAKVITPFVVDGWTFNSTTKYGEGLGVNLIRIFKGDKCSGEVIGETKNFTARPDVVKVFHLSDSYLYSGFSIEVDQPIGPLTLSVCSRNTDTNEFVAKKTVSLKIISPLKSLSLFISISFVALIGLLYLLQKYNLLDNRTSLVDNCHKEIFFSSIVLPAIALLFILFFLWVPFNLNSPPLWEVWATRAYLEGLHNYRLTSEMASRPLSIFPHFIAHHLSLNTSLGFNLFFIFIVWLKGLVVFSLMKHILPKQYSFAFLISVLFVIFPSDIAVSSVRMIHIQVAVLTYFLSVKFFLSAYQAKAWSSIILISASWVLLMVSCLTYEAGYPLMAITPALLLFINRKSHKITLITCSIWYLGMLTTALYQYQMTKLNVSYQSDFLDLATYDNSIPALILRIFENSLSVLHRNLYGVWPESISLLWQLPFFNISVACGILSFLVIWSYSMKNFLPLPLLTSKTYVYLAIVGIVILLLGTSTFLPINHYILSSERVYLYSSLGSVLFLLSVYLLVVNHIPLSLQKFSFTLPIIAIILFSNQVILRNRSFNIASIHEQMTLYPIIEQMPSYAENSIIILTTGTVPLSLSLYQPTVFKSAISYIYDDHKKLQEAHVCIENGPSYNRCSFTDSELIYAQTVRYPYDKIIIFNRDAITGKISLQQHIKTSTGFNVESYNPSKLINFDAPPPHRKHTFFPFYNGT